MTEPKNRTFLFISIFLSGRMPRIYPEIFGGALYMFDVHGGFGGEPFVTTRDSAVLVF
jgi:hypothetical protein